MRAPLLWLAAIGLVGLLAVLLLRTPIRAPGAAAGALAADAAATAVSLAPIARDDVAPPATEATSVARTAQPAERPRTSTTRPAAAVTRPFVGALVVRVVDERGHPVVGATVDLFSELAHGILGKIEEHESAVLDPREPPWLVPSSQADTAERRGVARGTSDADGRVHLPHTRSGHVVARTTRDDVVFSGRTALPWLNTRVGAEVEVVARRADAWDVRVVDASGAPASNVVVALMGNRTAPTELAMAATDTEGRARIVDTSRLRTGDAWLRAVVLGADVTALLPDAGTEALLSLPPTGSVTIELPNGVERSSVFLIHGRAHVHQRAEGGRARFERVALGLELAASSAGPLVARCPPFAGPATEGAEVVQRLPEAGIALKLLQPDGTPLSHRVVHVHWVHATTRMSPAAGALVRTDADGRLRTTPHAHSAILSTRITDAAGRARRLAATVQALPAGTPLATPADLGDVLLAELPLLAAGRVVDADGEPIPQATVYASTGPLPRAESRGRGVATAADGTFCLDDMPDGASGEVSVFAWARGYVDSTAVSGSPGATDHLIVLQRAATLTTSVALDSGPRHAAMRVRIERADGVALDESKPEQGAAERRYSWEDIEPGDWVLRISTMHDAPPLHEQPVRLSAGELRDLGRIDLSAALDLVVVRVFDSKEQPVEFRWRVRDEHGTGRWSTGRREALVPRTTPDAHVDVRVHGHYDGSAALEGRSVDITLRASPLARLAIPAGYPLPAASHALNLACLRVDDGGPRWVRYNVLVDGRADVQLGGPGRFVAQVNPVAGGPVLASTEFDLTAADLEAGRTIELPFDLDTWRKAVEAR